MGGRSHHLNPIPSCIVTTDWVAGWHSYRAHMNYNRMCRAAPLHNMRTHPQKLIEQLHWSCIG